MKLLLLAATFAASTGLPAGEVSPQLPASAALRPQQARPGFTAGNGAFEDAPAEPSVLHVRLAGLGRVWGFLKYFHPGIAAGALDWDSTLIASVPRVLDAATAAEHEAVLRDLIVAAGALPACTVCPVQYPDDMLHNLDLAWLDDPAIVPPPLAEALHRVRRDRHTGAGRYVRFGLTAVFDADTAHSEPALPPPAGRLLSLFRYWNAVQYFFPYLYVNDGDWGDVLLEFVPRMLAADDTAAYHLTVLELTTRVRDTHVTTRSPVIDRLLGDRVPPFTARSIEGHIVVTAASAGDSGLQQGDVITHIDGEPVAVRRQRLAHRVAAGNAATFERNLVALMLRDSAEHVTYDVSRAGVRARAGARFTSRLPPLPGTQRGELPRRPLSELVSTLPGGIVRIDAGALEVAQVDSIRDLLQDATGVVIDVRNYPRGTLHALTALLSPQRRAFVTFTAPDTTHPGVYSWGPVLETGPTEPGAAGFAGRVAILIDERTQSHAEFTVMALRTIPRNRVFGSQTAGADGNITYLALPGGIRTIFTGLGVYYPDRTPTQRIGIIPDVEVRPTLAAFLTGRDEVLERALEYVRGSSPH